MPASTINFLQGFSKGLHTINEIVGRAVSWLTGGLVLFVFFDVIAQKVFNFSAPWIMEVEWYLFGLIFLWGSGYALRHGKHVRVDLFYAKFSNRDKALTDFWGTTLFLIPWCLAVIWFSFGYAKESFIIREGSSQPNGLPALYLLKFAVTVGILLLLFQAIAMLLDAIVVLLSSGKQDSEDFIDDNQNLNTDGH